MFSDVFKAISQLGDSRFQAVLAKGIGLTLALLVAVYIVFVGVLGLFLPDTISLPFVGEIGLGLVLSIGSFFVMIGLSVFLMVPVASAFTGFFLDEVAEAVEDKHYPSLPAGDFGRGEYNRLGAVSTSKYRSPVDLLGAQRILAGPRIFSNGGGASLGA